MNLSGKKIQPKPLKEALSAADSALRQVQATLQGRAPETPTPERLLLAAGHVRIERVETVVDARDVKGEHRIETNDDVRIRIDDGPLARLRDRCLLAPKDPDLNRVLAAAALRFQTNWHCAGLCRFSSIDPGRPPGAGGIQSGLFSSELQVSHWIAYSSALKVLAGDVRVVTLGIVLEERSPLDLGQQISGYADRAQATAVALYQLRKGLQALAAHYSLTASTQCE